MLYYLGTNVLISHRRLNHLNYFLDLIHTSKMNQTYQMHFLIMMDNLLALMIKTMMQLRCTVQNNHKYELVGYRVKSIF